MVKKSILASLFILALFTRVQAHTLVLNAWDNEDGTITIAGAFDTGATAQGAMVRLEALAGGEILFKQRLPEASELTVKIPDQPYQIVLDGGPGHTVIQQGIPPEGGYAASTAKTDNTTASQGSSPQKQGMSRVQGPNIAYMVCTAAAFLFLGLTLLACRFQTNKLLAEIKKRP